jgi:hypothetical protein
MKGSHQAPLLCELHAHTIWGDGSLTIGQLIEGASKLPVGGSNLSGPIRRVV